jgi:hypothetical protein
LTSAGRAVARVLVGSWRAGPPDADFDESVLASVEQQLMASGAAGLAWWRIHADPRLSTSPVGARFNDAFRMHTLHAKMHEDQIVRVLDEMRANSIEPLMLKGWDAARMYPERGMRPYGDIDLWVRDEVLSGARAVLASSPDGYAVDLEHDLEDSGSSVESMFAAARTERLDETSVTVLCEEDRLRVLALHFLKSGGWRPSGLCDVAAAVESRYGGFDWDRCMTRDPTVAGWIQSAIVLSGHLLGADLRSTPAASTAPGWLVHAVLRSWARPWPGAHNAIRDPLPSLTHPVMLAKGLLQLRTDPVATSIAMRAPLDHAPRLPMQVAFWTRRLARYLRTQGQR